MTRKLHLVLLCSIFTVLAACNGSAAPTTTTSTTVKLGSPQDELDSLAKALDSVDYSRISESTCGKFSLIVIPGKVQFYSWAATGWTERSELFGEYSPGDPYLVTTRDYTNDGVNEFLVTSARKVPIGAIFGQIDCKWQWLTFQGQMGPEQTTVDGLTWSDDALQLSGIDYDENWNKLNSNFSWDPHYKTFFAEATETPSTQVEVSADCSLYMDKISYWELQKDNGKTYYQKSLTTCSREEWIAYADAHRSPYSTWETYMDSTTPYYTQGTGVILANDSPSDVLDYLCQVKKSGWKKQADAGGAFSSYARSQYNDLKNSACSK